jgi:acetyl-CoA carboxylase carboxyltransferase component
LNAALAAKRDEVRAGWGPEYEARVRKKGKLADLGSHRRAQGRGLPGPSDRDARQLRPRRSGGRREDSPGAGVVTAFVRVEGRWSSSSRTTTRSRRARGGRSTPEKIQRAQEIALRLRLPVVYLVDCSGLFLPEQAHTFPGRTERGAIFKMNARLSDAGVPQIAGSTATASRAAATCRSSRDVVYMTEQAYMVIAGAALVKGGKSQHITSLTIGGPGRPRAPVALRGSPRPGRRHLCPCVRARWRSSRAGCDYYRLRGDAADRRVPRRGARRPLPADHRRSYDDARGAARRGPITRCSASSCREPGAR